MKGSDMSDMSTREVREVIEAQKKAVTEKMFDMDDIIRYCLIALYTDGHVLLEGNPGLGKTALVKQLAQVLGLNYGRIQFTPDLMPTDVTGTYMPRLNNSQPPVEVQASMPDLVRAVYATVQGLTFQHGPIFTNLLLADEINRATPKTQSAMLEVMAERQVTVAGVTYTLDKEKKDPYKPNEWPFMVLATQNPIDHEGTYELPEAQSDRFMFKLDMPIPDRDALGKIIKKETDPSGFSQTYTTDISHDPIQLYQRVKQTIRQVKLNLLLEQHIENLFLASNKRDLNKFDKSNRKLIENIIKQMPYGLGPRAAIALTLGAKAWSLFFADNLDARSYDAVAKVVVPTLRHRMKLNYGWENEYKIIEKPYKWSNRSEAPQYLEQLIADFCLATAPDDKDYKKKVEETLRTMLEKPQGSSSHA